MVCLDDIDPIELALAVDRLQRKARDEVFRHMAIGEAVDEDETFGELLLAWLKGLNP